jgi:hypothetical protein
VEPSTLFSRSVLDRRQADSRRGPGLSGRRRRRRRTNRPEGNHPLGPLTAKGSREVSPLTREGDIGGDVEGDVLWSVDNVPVGPCYDCFEQW